MWALNGSDLPRLYDGTTWHQIFSTETYGLAYDGGTVLVLGRRDRHRRHFRRDRRGGRGHRHGIVRHLHIRSKTGTFQNDDENLTGGWRRRRGGEHPSGVTTITASQDHRAILHAGQPDHRLRLPQPVGSSPAKHAEPLTCRRWTSGAASTLNLTGVFTKGGWLGNHRHAWSSDAGDGLDDRIVFITNQGEAAVYSGSFADASNISFVGRFDIGSPPLGKNAFLSVGGDLIIMTEAGWIPMSAVVGTDEARLASVALTAQIEKLWRKMVADRGSVPWQAIRWRSAASR